MQYAWEQVLTEKSDVIRRYTAYGWQILLVHGIHDGVCTCGKPDCKDAGKHPVASNGIESATDDADWLISILGTNPHYNLAVAMGRRSGLIDLDTDSASAISDAQKKGGVKDTLSFDSGRDEGGRHFLFAYPTIRDDQVVRNGVEIAKDMDVRADGGYAVVPPSCHLSGRQYRWVNPPELFDLQPLPSWLLDRLVFGSTDRTTVEQNDEPVVEGGRNVYLFKKGCKLWGDSLSYDAIRGALHGENRARCQPPLTEEEVDQIVTSIVEHYDQGATGQSAEEQLAVEQMFGKPITELPDILLSSPLTDSGNAECLIELFGSQFRACPEITKNARRSKGVLTWNGHVWTEDVSREFRECAKKTARARRAVATLAADKEARSRMRTFALSSENLSRLEATCELASTEKSILVAPDAWDTHPMKLAVQNGVLNLLTGEFEDADPSDYLTQKAAVKYDAEATCPLWEKTLEEIFVDRPEVIPYIQRVFGYMLTGMTNEHIMWFWYGNGANGKSTLINIMSHVLGELAGTANFSSFDDRNMNDKNDDLAALRGKRFVAATEGEKSRKIAEAKIKLVVSDDKITCRFLYGTWFEYRPAWKLVLATNHLPEIRGVDEGIWRRVHLVEFTQKFEGEKRDRKLEDKLRKEASGIFNWCLVGLQSWLEKGGFDPPACVLKSTEDMREENDTVRGWFEDAVQETPGESIDLIAAFKSYRRWCEDNASGYLSKASWLHRLKLLGMTFEKQPKTGKRLAKGWELRTGDFG